jgi:hypothetical protein
MPTASRIENSRIDLLWNNDPMNTIRADIKTSSRKVLSPL